MIKIYDYFDEIDRAELFQIEEYGKVNDSLTCDYMQCMWEDLKTKIEKAFDGYKFATSYKYKGEYYLDEKKSIIDAIYEIGWDVNSITLTDRSIDLCGLELYISDYFEFQDWAYTDKEERHHYRQFFRKLVNPLEVWKSYINGGAVC